MSETPKPGQEVRKPQYYSQVMRDRILGDLALREIAEYMVIQEEPSEPITTD